jgi:hypothetical protein
MQHDEQPTRQCIKHVIVIASMAAFAFTACADPPEETASHVESVKIEPMEGSKLVRLTLTDEAAERLDIQTAPVDEAMVAATATSQGAPVRRRVVPYAAVLYDRAGDTWTYTTLQPLVFVRHAITVDYIDGQQAVLSAGPDIGTPVVTVGATELFGAEVGVDH